MGANTLVHITAKFIVVLVAIMFTMGIEYVTIALTHHLR